MARVEARPARAGPPADLEIVSEPIDFLGVNYYSQAVVGRTDATGRCRCASRLRLPVDGHGLDVAPDALHDLLVRLKREYGDFPIAITRTALRTTIRSRRTGSSRIPNGSRTRDHIEAVARAAAGVDVQGYFSLVAARQLRVGVRLRQAFRGSSTSTTTQRRIPKQSALWYRDPIAGEISRP